ncbi:hypothetical protein PGTUg99_035336 [Puccinia graminis f. sp. tritici]|uniref:Uncharacterized protein n=1 Tax=Puccinia graminis f. sp. tritici TaxID=56615 RepID=A0A5B0R8I9_PUCGR|nr:hypothetical protein PGTUg99_035336 [Puccinia graminis f. sp. tritici]
MIPDDIDETAPGDLKQSAGLHDEVIVEHASVPPAASRELFYPVAADEQSGSSKPRKFKAKLDQQIEIEGILGKEYSPGRKIVCTCGAGTVDAQKHVLLCTQTTSNHDAELSQWSAHDFHHEKVELNRSAHEHASGLSWRKYQFFRALNLSGQSHSQGQAPFLYRCSPVSKVAQPGEGYLSIGSSFPSKIDVDLSEAAPLIPARTTQLDSGNEWINPAFISQPSRLRFLPVERRSLVSQTLPESSISPVVPRLNVAANYPTESVEAKSNTTLISKPQAIILAFGLLTLLSLIGAGFLLYHVRRKKNKRGKHSGRHLDIPNKTLLCSPAMKDPSHRVTIEPTPSPTFSSSNAESNLKSDPSQPFHCVFGILHPPQTAIASEKLGDVTPALDRLQAENEMDKHPHDDAAIHTSLPSPIVSLTASFSTTAASPTRVDCQSAKEASDPACKESTSEGNLTCPRECNLKASAKSLSSLNGIHQPLDFSSFEREMENETCENQSSSPSMKERSMTTASSMRRRSYIVADRLSSILRPSNSTGFSDSSPKPLPLRRLKTSYGVGEECESDEEQDQAAISRFLRMQYAEWEVEQLARADAGGFIEPDSSSLSSVGFRSVEPQRRRSSVLSNMEPTTLKSLKKGSFTSMKAVQGAKYHTNNHFNYNSPSPHDFPPNPSSSSYPAMYEQDQSTLANFNSQPPNNAFFPNHSKVRSRLSSVLLAQDAQFCSSPKSLSSQGHRNIPSPVDMTHEQTCKDSPDLSHEQASATLAAYKKKHRHSKSAPLNFLRDSIDLEPIRELKLSVTNPDVELNESDAQRKAPDPVPQGLSNSTRTISRHMEAKDMHSSQPLPPAGARERSPSAGGAHSPGIDQFDSGTKIEEQSLMDATQKPDEDGDSTESPQRPRRRSWLSSSLSLRILPQSSPSKKGMALNMSPARLRKSLSIGGRMGSREMKAGLHPLDLETTSSNEHDSRPSCRAYTTSLDSPSLKDNTHNHQLDSQAIPKSHDFGKSSNSSLTTLFGLFTKSKRSSHILQHELLGISSSPSPTSEFMSSSSSSHSGQNSLNLFDSNRPGGSQSTISSSITTAMHSPIIDGFCSTHPNPYSSAPCACGDQETPNLAYGRKNRDVARIQWKSRLNSVGSFIDDLDTINQTPQSGLVIANPDMAQSNETDYTR